MNNVNEILAERGSRYGLFSCHAGIAQELKGVMRATPGWERGLEDDQREALEMIQHKIARILNGDPNYADSWVDIAGYAQLIVKRLEDNAKPDEPLPVLLTRAELELQLAEAMLADAARHV